MPSSPIDSKMSVSVFDESSKLLKTCDLFNIFSKVSSNLKIVVNCFASDSIALLLGIDFLLFSDLPVGGMALIQCLCLS